MAEQSSKPKGTFSKLMSTSPLPEDSAPQSSKLVNPENVDFRKAETENTNDIMIPRHHETMKPSNHDTMIPADQNEILEIVRKSVKQIGKEAATYRFTREEKNQLADIEYTYKRQEIRTSENEITRIAINYFIEDYRKNGEESLLAKILKRLNS
jgi:hypothetical protein